MHLSTIPPEVEKSLHEFHDDVVKIAKKISEFVRRKIKSLQDKKKITQNNPERVYTTPWDEYKEDDIDYLNMYEGGIPASYNRNLNE